MSYRMTDETFVNPYNFVSLGDHVCRKAASEYEGNLTGVISCTLTTKTPLMIPDSKTAETDNGHKVLKFFEINGHPIIPGSSIRGVIRSVYEAVTNSCLSTIEDVSLSSRTTTVKKSGILKFVGGKWELYDAQKYLIRTFGPETNNSYQILTNANGERYITANNGKFKTGDIIKFNGINTDQNGYDRTPTAIGLNNDNGLKEGCLLLGEISKNNDRRYHSHIFEITKNMLPMANARLLEDAVKNLEINLEYYRNPKVNISLLNENDKNRKHAGYNGYTLKKDGSPIPVFYEIVDNSIIYLAPACISRNVYRNTLYKICDEHIPCTNRKNLCKACGLFGMVGTEAVGSHVRFTDANLKTQDDDIWESDTLLKELASPKISCMEFYTKINLTGRNMPKVAVWNYDYVTFRNRSMRILDNCGNLKLKGRKFYWHHNQTNLSQSYADKTKTDRNSTITPIKSGVSFNFDVYFNEITKEALNRLVWVLSLGKSEENSEHFHKLGMGKPLGLGSVQIEIDEIKTRNINIAGDYNITSLPVDEYLTMPTQFSGLAYVEELMKISEFNAIKERTRISYPIGNDGNGTPNSQANHQWFVGNKQILGTGTNPIIDSFLPPITLDEEQTQLHALVKSNR